jgi:hypothetical protein
MLGVGIAEFAGLIIFLKITLDWVNCTKKNNQTVCYKNI